MIEPCINLCLGDLVYYIGPPIVSPLKWEYIVQNDNGIISKNDLGIIVDLDSFLKIADVFFQKQNFTIERISFRKLQLAN